MLYAGPLALKGLIDKSKYRHFLLFHTAMYALCSAAAEDSEQVTYAKTMLENFVNQDQSIYRRDFLV